MKSLKLIIILASILGLTGCHISYNGSAPNTATVGKPVSKIYDEKKFTRLNVNSINNDITFKEGKSYRVIYKGYKKLMPTVKQDKNTLTIKTKNTVKFSHKNPVLIIEMPKTYLQSAKIYTANGDINGSTLMIHSGNLKTDNGDISLDNLYLKKKLSVNTGDGDVNINNSNATGYKLTADNGNVTFNGNDYDDSFKKNVSSKSILHVYSDNGDISVN
ncbi:DUF4097 family beta strand repeat-containing protein [Lactobacillus intestinalis]|uniref:DUF4097 family beta strand repeat-containing protein n=1 Tax=Lactobacillus intestinalis TaxID=151781 RepID=UPI001F57C298|nr:DUF4097 family beta strand repeat-containing protein [Lactobacillus intestinalis]